MAVDGGAPFLADAAGRREAAGREAAEESGRLAALAAPMIAVALLQLLMQLISTVMVGHLGEVALAGAAIANSLTNVSGFSVLVSSLPPTPLSVCRSFHIFVYIFCIMILCVLVVSRHGRMGDDFSYLGIHSVPTRCLYECLRRGG